MCSNSMISYIVYIKANVAALFDLALYVCSLDCGVSGVVYAFRAEQLKPFASPSVLVGSSIYLTQPL